jgi:hypothetical protein
MSAPIAERLTIADELLLEAKAFRENTVYDSDGNPIRLITNAERMEQAAATITELLAALEGVVLSRDDRCCDQEVFQRSESYGESWTPSASMVGSEAIAKARQAIASATGEA